MELKTRIMETVVGRGLLAALAACDADPAWTSQAALAAPSAASPDAANASHAKTMLDEGRNTFRFGTFGSEAFWGDQLQLHTTIAGERNGGVGPGVLPKTALSVDLKVDADALKQQLARGEVDLDDPATTIALIPRRRLGLNQGVIDMALRGSRAAR